MNFKWEYFPKFFSITIIKYYQHFYLLKRFEPNTINEIYYKTIRTREEAYAGNNWSDWWKGL